MIYLTAQPDRTKFYWQLKVQLENFRQMGINMRDVHVVVGMDVQPTPSPGMLSLRDTGAQIFFYPYARDYRYISSVRPHILKQHFAAFPSLSKEYMLYMDCDVIFNRLPDFSKLNLDGFNWYVSDTRSYISAGYIRGCGPTVFSDMCQIVGIPEKLVLDKEEQSGGCQYIMTGINSRYWEKVEKDCINLFTSFPNFWNTSLKKFEGPNQARYEGLGEKAPQIWCADMWAVLWNAWLLGHNTYITEELDFSWAVHSIEDFSRMPLFHLAGVVDEAQDPTKNPYAPHFDKRLYDNSVPFFDDFSHINIKSATFPYVQLIKHIRHANANNY